MQKDIAQVSSASILKRVLELWPYLFIAVSVVGLAYVALNGYLMSR
jgi:hypothetical protein